MGAIASLGQRVVAVAPGAEASVEIKVRNTGTVVDQMTLSVLGEAADWSSAEPRALSLFPGAEDIARIVFRPPRASSTPAGALPFGVRVASGEDPAGSVVEEGSLEISPFSDMSAELQPRMSRGSRGARYDLAVDNRGNVPLNATIEGSDAANALGFDIAPPGIVADAGQASFSRVGVRPRRRFWRGQPRTHAFVVQVSATGQPPLPVEGSLLQEPLLPPWLLKALLALAVLFIALLLLWFLVLRPSVLTAAQEAAEETAEQVVAERMAAAAEQPGGQPAEVPAGGGEPTPSPTPTPTPSPTPTPTPSPTPTPTPSPTPTPTRPPDEPTDGRLRAREVLTLKPGKTLFITDLVFSNPLAETGALRLLRNDQPLLDLRLEHFRDLDFHFVTPVVVRPGDEIELRCDSCEQPAVYYSGYLR